MGREEINNIERKFGPVKAAVGLFGESISEGKSFLKKTHTHYIENQSPKASEYPMTEEESELSKAKKTVQDLTLKVEQSGLKAKLRMQDLEQLKLGKQVQERRALVVKVTDSFANYAKVIRDVEKIKRNLSKLKLEVEGVLEEKKQADNKARSLNSRIDTCTKSVYALREEIEEVSDEQVLVELAEIEARKELADIEYQREVEAQKFLLETENTKRKMKEILEEIELSKELEKKLALTNRDIEMLENEIKMFKETDTRVSSFREGTEIDSSSGLKSVLEELELAKSELALLREEGIQLMASMDVIRDELIQFSEKTARLKMKDKKADQNVSNLNSKLLKAKTKFEAVSSSEEKAKTLVENLILTCENLKTETEASRKERDFTVEETMKIKIQTDESKMELELAEMKLNGVLQDIEDVKLSEVIVLDKLKIIAEKTLIDRAFRSKHSSTITISKFEYEYLRSRSAEAQEVADKKVLAAQGWIKALKANKDAIHMETEIAERKIREKKEEEDMERLLREKSIRNSSENLEVENSEFGGDRRRRSMKYKAKLRIPSSPGFRYASRSSNVNIKRREKLIPDLGKLFNS